MSSTSLRKSTLTVLPILGLALLALASLCAPELAGADEKPSTGTLVITAHSFKSDDGQAVIAIYRRGEHWLDPGKAYKRLVLPIKDGKVSVTIKDLPYDTYAVAVVHDTNQNGKMDMRYLPYPKPEEGGGVSNNYVRSGKPEYSKAKFEFARALMSVRITVIYS